VKNKLQQVCVSLEGSLKDAMTSLTRNGTAITLVTDSSNRLIGVLNDGDIRRALLSGAALDSPLADYTVRDFTSVRPGVGRAEILDLMQARILEQIPVVDESGQLVGLHLIHELLGCAERPNWAVIMAGGKGERLLPATEHVPKPMIRVAGRPILERLVLHLVGSGIRRIYLSINHLGHIIEQHFGDGKKFGCCIEYLREEQPLGTGGALSLLPQDVTDPVLVLNGDLVTQVDVGLMLEFHTQGKYVATIGAREYSHTVPFGCVEVLDGEVNEFVEKPTLTRLINAGIYVISPAMLDRVPEREFPITDLLTDCMRREESIGAYEVGDDWIDVGQRKFLTRAQKGEASES